MDSSGKDRTEVNLSGSEDAHQREDKPRPLGEHFEELRYRLLVSAAVILAVAIAAWIKFDWVNSFILQPLSDVSTRLERNITPPTMRPTEGFIYLLKLGIFTGLIVASPVILYQAWSFVAPGLTHREKRIIRPVFLSGAVFFIAGAAMAYYYVVPAALYYLGWIDKRLGFQSYWRVAEYSSFLLNLMLVFGLSFELPLVMAALGLAGIVKPAALLRPLKYVVAVSFIIGAVLTPPDVTTQIMMAVTLVGLYIVGVAFARVGYRYSTRRSSETETPESNPGEGSDNPNHNR